MSSIRALWHRIAERMGGGASGDGAVLLRMALVLAAVGVGFGWVVAQAAVYQLSDSRILTERGEARVNASFAIQGRRGDVLDRTGRRLLAVTVPSPSIAFYGAPYYVDRRELSFALAEALGLEPEDVVRKVIAEESFAMLKRHVTPEDAAAIERLALPGVRVIQEDRRFYPLEDVLGSTLGYVTKSGQGAAGLEASYDALLRGSNRVVSVLRDSARRGFYNDTMSDPWAVDGANLVLSVDAQVQLALESELIAKVAEEQALAAMGIVLDARTFEVLGMASLPALDPNRFETQCGDTDKVDDGTSPCRNKVVSYVYEIGSIGKLFTLSAAIESGRMSPDSLVDGHLGSCAVGTFRITDVHRMGVGTLSDATMYSSNCAFKDVALRVGPELLRDTFERFGLGRGTGIDLPGAAAGHLPSIKAWGSTGLQTAGYGYGYSTTLLHVATAMATITNDGVRLAPRVAREARTRSDEVVRRLDAPPPVRVVSADTARKVREVLARVVMDPHGTGRKARPTAWSAAGKTGTARVNVVNQGYTADRYLCSFVGFAPAEDPRIVVAITVIDPKVNHYGGTVAAPVFKGVADRVLPILGVEPTLPVEGRLAKAVAH
ncbi:MAG: penicillin-binding protein 2 [Deltaproteobacteria bacterium]|nr:penicillin-binding protein 2 [Deltaproteobacteria bacterium]